MYSVYRIDEQGEVDEMIDESPKMSEAMDIALAESSMRKIEVAVVDDEGNEIARYISGRQPL